MEEWIRLVLTGDLFHLLQQHVILKQIEIMLGIFVKTIMMALCVCVCVCVLVHMCVCVCVCVCIYIYIYT
jgi:hypothetical protein